MISNVQGGSTGTLFTICRPVQVFCSVRPLAGSGRIFDAAGMPMHFVYSPSVGRGQQWQQGDGAGGGQNTADDEVEHVFSGGSLVTLPWPGLLEWRGGGTGTLQIRFWWRLMNFKKGETYRASWHKRARQCANGVPVTLNPYVEMVSCVQTRNFSDSDGVTMALSSTPLTVSDTPTITLIGGTPTKIHEWFQW